VKPNEDSIGVAAGDAQLAEGSVPAGSNAGAAIGEVPLARMELQARALRLSAELRMRVGVDATGFLNDKVAIAFHFGRRRTIRPYFVRVGHLAPDTALSGERGVLACCRGYNVALERLNQLADQLETKVRTGRITLVPDSALVDAYEELSGLDELVALRQTTYMGSRVVHLDRLGEEINFLAGCVARLGPIVEEAEAAALAGRPREPSEPQQSMHRQIRWPHWIWRSYRDGGS
jgi:hypothetical protein